MQGLSHHNMAILEMCKKQVESSENYLSEAAQLGFPIRTEAKGEILTARAVEARLRSLAMVLQLQEKSPVMIERERAKIEKAFVEGFAKMSAESRTALVFAESRVLRLLGWFTTLSPGQQRTKLYSAAIARGTDTSALILAEQLEQYAIKRNTLPAGLEQMITMPSLQGELQGPRP